MFRDEGPYLAEWIRFHQAQGFSKFYLFDDKSSDDFREVLDPYIREGIVVLSSPPTVTADFHNQARQQVCFNIGLAMAKKECDWVAIIDVDEFLFAPNGRLADVLPKDRFVAGVFIPWRMFGSSGHEHPPEAGVLASYTKRARIPATVKEMKAMKVMQSVFFGENVKRPINGRLFNGKSIVRPRLMMRYGVHYPALFLGRLIDENGVTILLRNHRWFNGLRRGAIPRGEGLPTSEIIRINHYWSKSVSDMKSRSLRRPHGGSGVDDYVRWDAEVLNAIEDREIFREFPSAGKQFQGNS